jgi:SWI/SNF-related matrix-associated actin-dependent regulator of chromatin subfamily E protein 1
LDGAIVNTSISSLMATLQPLQPVAVDTLWSDSTTAAHATAATTVDTGSLSFLMAPMTGTQPMNASMMSLGFPYSVTLPLSQAAITSVLDSRPTVSSNLSLTTQNYHLVQAQEPSSRSASGGGNNDGRASPFQTLNRFAFDTSVVDVTSPAYDENAKLGQNKRPLAVPQETVGAASVCGSLKPPKKSLTPYMRFSKAIWPQVKQANPDMSVCDIGSIIGKLWRQLGDADKKLYFDEFNRGKDEYNDELKVYLDATGLKSSDLSKPRARKEGATPKKPRSGAQQPSSQSEQMQTVVSNSVSSVKTEQWLPSSSANNPLSWPVIGNTTVATSVPVGMEVSAAAPSYSVSRMSMLPNAGHQPTATAIVPMPMTSAMQSDAGMLVFHLRTDGTRECYIEHGHVNGAALSAVSTDSKMNDRNHLLGVLSEKVSIVKTLKAQLNTAHARINELAQQNELLKQIRDANLAIR